jgi:asparagine synthase (glutamine-hydrolysing)
MCGINGILCSNNKIIEKDITHDIRLMNNAIIHRGPDDYGEFVINKEKYSCALGMRRLSIIDINSGKQPIYSQDGKLVIVFNGEIYNYKSLRESLVSEGHRFFTNSDTEVILKLYEIYGTSSFSKLDGMFAFSIYDSIKNKVFIARDFFGEKPLYYTNTNNCFIWSSELKSTLKILNHKPSISQFSISLFFQLTYIPSPFTIYENIFKLEPNYFLQIDCETQSISKNEIFRDFKTFDIKSDKEAYKLTYNLVNESVLSRSISDVPIGTFLSGGVDSSIISLCLASQSNKRIDTFSIGFEKKSFDESEKSRIVSRLINSKHHEFIIGEKDLSINIDDIILNFDEPFADSSALATFLVSKKTSDYVKVALTGDGGDEVFGGYNKYYTGIINKYYTNIIPYQLHKFSKKLIKNLFKEQEDNRGIKFRINKLYNSIDYSQNYYTKILSLGFQRQDLENILTHKISSDNFSYFKNKLDFSINSIHNYREIDKLISLEGDMLVKVDRMSMLSSLECRAPFLNKNLWDFSSQLPEDLLIRRFNKKFILKKAFEKYFPYNFLNKSKQGFGVPVGDWLRGNLKKELEKLSSSIFLDKQGIFNTSEIQKIINLHINNKTDYSFQVWTFYCFQKWYINNYEI